MIDNTTKKITVIGSASGLGGNILGCKDGPDVLRGRGLIGALEKLGYNVNDFGNAQVNKKHQVTFKKETTAEEAKINSIQETYSVCAELSDLVDQALRQNTFPLVLGGDHSLSIGSVASFANFYQLQGKDLGLIWIDTHADANTPFTSPSNNPFGMAVAFLLGLIPGSLKNLQTKLPAIKPENLVYLGLRDIDPGEKKLIKDSGITAFSMKEIDIKGIAQIAGQAIEAASKNTAGFIVSFDLDVCEPQLVPGTGTPYRGGLSLREAHLVMEMLYDSRKMLGLELVELNPSLDKNFQTADFAVALIESAMGKSIL